MHDSKNHREIHLLGVKALQQGEYHDAILLIGEAISLEPNVANYYCSFGIVLSKLNLLDRSLECFDKAISLDAKSSDNYANKAIVLKEIGEK